MNNYIKTYNQNYNKKDLLKFFANEFTAPLATIDSYSNISKTFGFRDYQYIIDNKKIYIFEYNYINNTRNIIFEINIKNFNIWQDFEKYLKRI